MSLTNVSLSLLVDDNANVRRTGRGSEPALVASIKAKGVLLPLIVRKDGDRYSVTDGGKRLASLHWLRDHDEAAAGEPVTDNYMVPIMVRDDDDAGARDVSLTTAIVRTPLHPVDQFEAFAELQASGMSSADIAAHYGLGDKEVKQRLALGGLAPVVRDAWRNETIGADIAQAFTLLPGLEAQEALFHRLKKARHLQRYYVREAIGAENQDAGRYLKFVGEKAYEAAGGKVIKDLFGDDHVLSDPALAKQLSDAKLQAKVDALLKDGWSWVALAEEVQNRWALGRIEKKKGAFSKADKAKAGCIVALAWNGQLEVDYGLLKPDIARKQKAAEKVEQRKADGQPEDAISQALAHRLSIVLTKTAAAAVAAEPSIALAALIANFSEGVYSDAPTKLRNDARVYGRPSQRDAGDAGLDEDPEDDVEEMGFEDAFAAAMKLTLARQLAEAAKIIGRSFDFQRHNGGSAIHDDPAVAALCNALDVTAMKKALLEAFDPADYFGGVNGAMRSKAVAEAVNPDEAAKVARMKKPDAVAYCVANVAPTGWLPPELRTAHYDGPGGKVAEPAKAGKKAPAKKAAPARKKAA